MTHTITAFADSPDRGQGQARDMRVRWALEEVGQRYDVRLLSFEAMKQPAHQRLHPFGQIPTYEEGGLRLFESGAIVLHVAERHEGLLPAQPEAKACAIMWMFAALNTIEPPIVELEISEYLEGDKPWRAEREAMIEQRLRARLDALAPLLADRQWLEGSFSAGDLMMVTVLRRLNGSAILADYPGLTTYVQRAEERPAFLRAFADQLAVYNNRTVPAPAGGPADRSEEA